jgi:hypothetical protein
VTGAENFEIGSLEYCIVASESEESVEVADTVDNKDPWVVV